MKTKLFLFLIIFFLIDFIISLGVSPASFYIDFKPNLTISFRMGIRNSPIQEDRDIEVYFSLKKLDKNIIDEFRNVIELEKRFIHLTKEEKWKYLTVYLNFPEGFSKGGIHELRVGAVPVTTKEGISVRAGNEIRIFVNVSDEYVDEKYRVIKKLEIIGINAENVKQGEISDIEIKVKSKSEVDLNDVYAIINISKREKIIRILKTEKIKISPNEEKTLKTTLNTKNIDPGVLNLDIEVFYAGGSIKARSSLNIIGKEKRGMMIEKKKFEFSWWWILLLIIIILLLIIIFLLILLLKSKKDK